MKQYTTPEQTAKLIELGFREPKSKVGGRIIYEPDADLEIEWKEAYSIGELIEMLKYRSVSINVVGFEWSVDTYYYGTNKYELIDALFAMVVKCKEEGEI